MIDLLASQQPGYSLSADFYQGTEVYEADLAHVWHREWIFAANACELQHPGEHVVVQIGAYNLLILRGDDGVIRALHNVCRHRGFRLCEETTGVLRRRIVCPYHQWSYALDGSLAKARAMEADFDLSANGLLEAACEDVGGMVFVCLSDMPPDITPLRHMVEPYLAPFDLRHAKVAFTSTFVEHGNWKLVMENNRECYHCRAQHPELCVMFPIAPLHSGGGSPDELAEMDRLVDRCEAAGLASRYVAAPDHQYRAMRMPFLAGMSSMTPDGQPAVQRRFPGLPDASVDVGDVLFYHYPSTWNHFVGDHALTFRITPTGPTTTELRTTWLVPADAVEGVDYDLATLTRVWQATNAQDAALVERAQRGISSPAYRPGRYSLVEEEGVLQFVTWYLDTLRHGLAGDSAG